MPYKRALPVVLAALVLTSACAHAPRSAAPVTHRYTVLMSTNHAGTQVVTVAGRTRTTDFEFNDRGRGPKTHTVALLDASDLPVSVTTTGNDYLKQQVTETFASDANAARWSNPAEHGDAPAGGFYASMYGPPEELAMLVRAATRKGGRVALLPGGEASVRRVDTRDVRGLRVSAWEISGLGFTPTEVWLEDESQELFGALSSWSSIVRDGYESDVRPLIDAQDARASARIAEIARRDTHRPTMGRLSIVNARIFDPRTGSLSAPTTINIEGNRIAAIGAAEERNAADVLDAGGRIAMPGLWDMHTHNGETDGLLDIAAGITSVRDLGNDSDFIVAFRKKIEAGESIGPRIVLAGLVDGPGPFQGPTNILAGNEEEAIKAVDFFASRGYEGLKIYSSIKPELVPVLTKRAHEHGMRVSGHVPAGMRATDAIDAGYDEIQHANMLFLNFMPDVTDTRTPARFTEPAKRGADLDLQSDDVRAFIAKLRERGTVIDPTVTVFESMFTARAGHVDAAYAAIAERMPPQVRRWFLSGGLPVPDGMDDRYRASFRKMLDLVAELHRSGVKIVAGTDGMAGFTLHRELESYAAAGIAPADVLRIATLAPAEILGRTKDLGTIEVGKLADIVLVDGNPLENMSDIRRTWRVVKGGNWFDPAELYRELGLAP